MPLLREEHGQDLVEYVLLCFMISLAAVGGAKSVATGVNNALGNSGTQLTAAVANTGGQGNNNNNNNNNNHHHHNHNDH